MPRQASQLFDEALALPAAERAALADSLLESLDAEAEEGVEQAWREEIDRRIAAVDEGTTKLVPWEEVRDRLRRRLQR